MKKILSILVLAIVAVQFAFAGDVITKEGTSTVRTELYQSVFQQTADFIHQDRQ